MPQERRLLIPLELRGFVSHLPPFVRRKVRAGLEAILDDFRVGKPLVRDLQGFWSLAVGSFRIIYRPSGDLIEIVAVGPRSSIYEEVARRLMPRKP